MYVDSLIYLYIQSKKKNIRHYKGDFKLNLICTILIYGPLYCEPSGTPVIYPITSLSLLPEQLGDGFVVLPVLYELW